MAYTNKTNTNTLIKGQLKSVRIKWYVQGQSGHQMRECQWVGRELCRVLPVDDSHSVAKDEPKKVETKGKIPKTH